MDHAADRRPALRVQINRAASAIAVRPRRARGNALGSNDYSITSSASSTKELGSVSPIALAVFRFTISS